MTRASEADEAALTSHAQELATALEQLVPLWIERSVRMRSGFDIAASQEIATATSNAVRDFAQGELLELRALLETDIDQQRVAPMALLRAAVRHPTAVLELAGVPHHRRDDFTRSQFPDDHYDLTPATWSDVHPDLHGPGIAWGAAKAFVHLTRRKAEGQR